MTEPEKDKSTTEKAKEVGDKLVENLRPSEGAEPGTGESGAGTSNPFSGGDRPDEQSGGRD